jgi:hypothetical protein
MYEILLKVNNYKQGESAKLLSYVKQIYEK